MPYHQNVLMSMPIYLLSAMNPPKKVIERIHQVFARLFLGEGWWRKR